MLDFLFARLTADPRRGTPLFNSLTKIAREPHWFIEGSVPDTLDGRFAVLASVTALMLVRLEADGEEGNLVSVALTERFIEVMESEHRELGLGDPTLGRTVRKLVGSLARRTDLWRASVDGEIEWPAAVSECLYKSDRQAHGLEHSEDALRRLWSKLQQSTLENIEQGKLT